MAILQLKCRVAPTSGSAITVSASNPTASTVNYYFDTNQIVWPTLKAATGSLVQSEFEYNLPNDGAQSVFVNNSVAAIASYANSTAASAVVVP